VDAKTIHNLVFLAVLSMFCSGFAWAVGAVVKRRGMCRRRHDHTDLTANQIR
jgi:hypothetical protein